MIYLAIGGVVGLLFVTALLAFLLVKLEAEMNHRERAWRAERAELISAVKSPTYLPRGETVPPPSDHHNPATFLPLPLSGPSG